MKAVTWLAITALTPIALIVPAMTQETPPPPPVSAALAPAMPQQASPLPPVPMALTMPAMAQQASPLPPTPMALMAPAMAPEAPPLPPPPTAQAPAAPPKPMTPPPSPPPNYQAALDYINSAQYQLALDKLQANMSGLDTGAYADAAMYWRAYAESKLGRDADALQLLNELKSAYAKSTWLPDADALALELRQASGQQVSPASQNDDDLKLLAINGLMQSSPEQALPLLEKVVTGNSSPAVKRRALFVLAQNHSPASINELANIASEKGDPMLSQDAVRYLGMMGGENGRVALAKIYDGASPAMKDQILRGYFLGGDRTRLLAAAKSETNPEVQSVAIRDLGLAGGKSELAQLYQANPSAASKGEIIRALFLSGGVDQLIPLAQSEKDPELRLEAIRELGLIRSPKTQDALGSLYAGTANRDISKAVIQAMYLQDNASGLVALARKESDPTLKREIVARLSLMHNPAATAYLMELLNH